VPGIHMCNLILQALSDFETDKSGKHPAKQLFVCRYPWMVSGHFLKKSVMHLFALKRPPVPGLLFKHIPGLILNWAKSGSMHNHFASSADAIQLKHDHTRLRAFFLSSENTNNNYCLKIVSNKHDIAYRTRDELKTRKALENFSSISIPKIIYTREDDMFIYIVEELIKGRRFRIWQDLKLFKNQGLRELSNTYQLYGVRYEPLQSYLPENIINKVARVLQGLPHSDTFLHELQIAYSANPAVPVSLCHCDLLPSNIGVSNGRLYFFDWEKSQYGTIFHDLMKLPMKYPAITGKLIDAVLTLMKKDFSVNTLSLQHQFTTYTALRVSNKPENASVFLKIWNHYISRC